MPFFPSLPDDATTADVFKSDRELFQPFSAFTEKVMRGHSQLTPGERELIGAYVSALNECSYCAGGHIAAAAEFGIESGILEQLLENVDNSDVDTKLRPILKFVGKLTKTPERMVQADSDAVFAAGWIEEALRTAIAVCGLFSFMNRLVYGYGIKTDAGRFTERGRRHYEMGYDMKPE
jgi:uncharacterized peroxidase-related enzyme